MAFSRSGDRDSRIRLLIDAADVYHLDRGEAESIVANQVATIQDEWDEVCDQAELTAAQRDAFWHHQFLNPHAFE